MTLCRQVHTSGEELVLSWLTSLYEEEKKSMGFPSNEVSLDSLEGLPGSKTMNNDLKPVLGEQSCDGDMHFGNAKET